MITLRQQHIQLIEHHAEQMYAHECCGLLIGHIIEEVTGRHKVVRQTQPAHNSWDSQKQEPQTPELTTHRRYWVSPEQFLQAQTDARALGCDIIGVYHSHPDHSAVPSECDRQWAWPQYSYIIVSVQQGIACDVQSWMLDEHNRFQSEPVIIG